MKRIIDILAAAALLFLAVSCTPQEKHAKYVFYFIGDGMGMTHVAAAEAYLAQERGVIGMDPLCFTQFPVMGEATSFSASNIITDSAAAGTALSTGEKKLLSTAKQILESELIYSGGYTMEEADEMVETNI